MDADFQGMGRGALDRSGRTQVTVARGSSTEARGKAKLGVLVFEDGERNGRSNGKMVGVNADCASLCVTV